MEYADMLNKVANQVGIDEGALADKASAIFATEGAGWQASGKTEEECKILALRVAARQVTAEKARLARSGADLYEGMFVSVPRPKDWAGMAYKKMKGTLDSLDTDARMALVTQGAVQIFEDNHDGTFTCHYNPSLEAKQTFEEDVASKDIQSLPKRSMALSDGSHFSLIWDKNNKEFANGNANFKYGSLRPLEELDRTCIFYGRNAAGNGNVGQIEVRLSGEQAKIQFPTFVTGTIGLKTANRAGLCYGTKATQFNTDPSKSDIFGQPPLVLTDGAPSGIVADWLGETLLPSLEKCAEVYDTLDQKEKWNTTFATVVEVVHIDPRERGGFVLSLADTDIMSGAPVIDMIVPSEHEGEVDFGIGSEIVIIGSPWTTKEGELRFSTSGWWCVNAMTPLADTMDADTETGWDAE
jgi:hypothetical protein